MQQRLCFLFDMYAFPSSTAVVVGRFWTYIRNYVTVSLQPKKRRILILLHFKRGLSPKQLLFPNILIFLFLCLPISRTTRHRVEIKYNKYIKFKKEIRIIETDCLFMWTFWKSFAHGLTRICTKYVFIQ